MSADAPSAATGPMAPGVFTIRRVSKELADVFTLHLEPKESRGFPFAPGQFNMLYQFGVGEVAISISGDPAHPRELLHTIRAVGTVTRAMESLERGDAVGVRGPFGTAWPLSEARGRDVVVMAGGLGLAPLRPAIYHLLAHRDAYRKIAVLYGARTPDDLLFRKELVQWRARLDVGVHVTVDRAPAGWYGDAGVVTELLRVVDFDPKETFALVCGPEVMMRFAARELARRGVPESRVFVSLERSMKCGVGLCGHCQYGPLFVCKDGPVVPFERVAGLFHCREV